MKKITLLLAAVMVGSVAFAQSTVIDRFPDNSQGLISVGGNDELFVACADEFVITQRMAVGELKFNGFGTPGSDVPNLTTGFGLYIFNDGSGTPLETPVATAGAILALENIPASDITITDLGNNVTEFTIPVTAVNGGEQVILEPGTYWVSAYPITNIETGEDEGRWNWRGSFTAAVNKPVLIDPADLFGGGFTSWTVIETIIAPDLFPAFAWSMTDEALLNVNTNLSEVVSVYPNPSSDVFKISLPSNVEVLNSSLVDILGKTTGVVYNNGQMNVSSLAPGVYFMNLETNLGAYNQKVVVKQ